MFLCIHNKKISKLHTKLHKFKVYLKYEKQNIRNII